MGQGERRAQYNILIWEVCGVGCYRCGGSKQDVGWLKSMCVVVSYRCRWRVFNWCVLVGWKEGM